MTRLRRRAVRAWSSKRGVTGRSSATYRLAVQVMERRELLGLTQTELAEKTGIDQGDIGRIERGSILPNEKTLVRLADALGTEWRMVDKVTA
jgi:predicted transcriptional regulator